MSLIDPDTRWWRRSGTGRTIAYLCIALGVCCAFVGSWGMFGLAGQRVVLVPVGIALVGVTAAIPLLVGGTLIYAFLVGESTSRSRVVSWSIPSYFIATGAGGVLGAYESGTGFNAGSVAFVVLIVGGTVAIVVVETLRRRSRAASIVRKRAEQHGVATRGTVTRAQNYLVNYQLVTRVTVRFTDADGKTRWARQTIPGNITTGSQVNLRYSPDDLGSKAAVIVSR